MKVTGMDWLNNGCIDTLAICEMEVTGDYKAPLPHNVIYTVTNMKTLEVALVPKS